jgi:hypothetical protein
MGFTPTIFRPLTVIVLLGFAASCYPSIHRAPAPKSIGEPAPDTFLLTDDKLLVLPVWRFPEGYRLGKPVVTSVGEFDQLPTRIKRYWLAGFRLGEHFTGPYKRLRYLYVFASSGKILLFKNATEWRINFQADMGSRWKSELLSTLSDRTEVPLLQVNGNMNELWGLASVQRFSHQVLECSPTADIPDYMVDLRQDICAAQRLYIEYTRTQRQALVEFVERIQTRSRADVETWSQVQHLPFIGP